MAVLGSYGSYALELQAAMDALQNQYNYAALAQAQDQFLKQLAWTKAVNAADAALQQQQLLGYVQTSPYLKAKNANVLTYGTEPWARTLEREQAEWNAGLNYANLLAGLSGPQDWIKYINVVRGLGSNYSYPAYMQAVAAQAGLPSFQAYVGDSPSYEDLWNNAAAANSAATPPAANTTSPATGNSGGSTTGGTTGSTTNAAAAALADWQPPKGHQVSMRTLNSLLPTELAMLQGNVAAAGYNWDDYVKQAQAAAPAAFNMANTLWAR